MSRSQRIFRLAFGVLLFISLLAACKLPAPGSVQAPPQPSYTQLPTYTAFPTYTFQATYTPLPTYTIQVFYTVDITLAPTPSPQPGVLVRIRNNTEGDVNLYRHGRTGELHFLGWLVPHYYGEFRFPDYGEWTIQYCRRDLLGDSFNCRDKDIVVKKDGQEFGVP